MNCTFRSLPVALALALLAVPSLAQSDQEQKLRVAKTVYEELMSTPDRAAPRWMEEDAKCIAVVPNLIKGAFMWGGRRGKGVITCRGGGKWSPPAFIKLTGGSFGFQVGGESADLVLFFVSERGVRSLLTSQVVLGADASAVAGPVGRKAGAGTDARLKAEIFAYARARGLFAGVAVEGSRLAIDQKAMRSYYGERIFPERVLFEQQAPKTTAAAKSFLAVLP